MKIKNKLTLLFSLIFAGILFLFSVWVYISYERERQENFYKQLKQQAITKVNLLLVMKLNPKVLQVIYRNASHNEINEEIGIFDVSSNLIYHDAADIDFIEESPAMIQEILEKKEIRIVKEDHQAIGFTVFRGGKTYAVTAVAYDEFGYEKLESLFYTLLTAFFASMLLVIAAGRYFAKQALRPVSELVEQVEEITETNLDQRVNEGNGKDEISELAITFNQMLNRLEHSFEAYKQFVSNIAHELRTPLAAIIAELELSENRERSVAEYKLVIKNALSDAQRLARLSGSLLDLAKTSYDPAKISFKEVRVDEVLLEARSQIQKLNSACSVNIEFKEALDQDEPLFVKGNEYLLKIAFLNVIDNCCKFSEDKSCRILISLEKKHVLLTFIDKGIGISPEELPDIFVPFYRGSNKGYADGNGIGLSLTDKIIKLHNGHIHVTSEINKGTTFKISLPCLI